MPVPVDPFPDFVNGSTVADGDQVDARFKALYDALDPAQVGIGNANIAAAANIAGSKLADASVSTVKLEDAAAFLLKVGGGVRKINYGVGTVEFLTAKCSGLVAHGMATTPSVVLAFAATANLFAEPIVLHGYADSVNILVRGAFRNGFDPSDGYTASFWWVAIGG